ncbi:unnamed protein product [Effrenium voratum]|uniref:ERCC1-like central domain-containing protein n=1 Tax=Effrenium voratum TaxID=2562239 RepID=A0AA36JKD9_9DINO|nr:unnamed protein product [Effrenium voratum]CAJ1407823.1 unnamed protein product [Effrenium voratum]CAJ1456099.1 unnamed protein product [Effrenium voratum]
MARSSQAIVARTRQQANPVLSCIRSTLVEFVADDTLSADFLAGPDTAVLFISLRFQRVHPEYLDRRIQGLGEWRNRILLCRVDVEQPEEALEQVTLAAFHGKLSLLLAWTDAEAAAYIETLHRYQSKGAEALMGRLNQDHHARHLEVLTTIKGINKTDAAALSTCFGSFAGVAKASSEDLQRCSGIGDKKVRQLSNVFHKPFFPR